MRVEENSRESQLSTSENSRPCLARALCCSVVKTVIGTREDMKYRLRGRPDITDVLIITFQFCNRKLHLKASERLEGVPHKGRKRVVVVLYTDYVIQFH